MKIVQQEEIVLVFSADYNICPKRLVPENENQEAKEEGKEEVKQEQENEPQLIKEVKDGIIQIDVKGLSGINQQIQNNNSSDTDSTIYSNQVIFRTIDQESLLKVGSQKRQQFLLPQDETSEINRNDEAPFNQTVQLIYHPEQANLPISVVKNVIEFLNFDRSKRVNIFNIESKDQFYFNQFIKRKQLESFTLNIGSIEWLTNQTINISVLLQNDILYRNAILNLSLSFIRNRFTQNSECSLILKSFEIKDIKAKDFLESYYFNFYIQGYDTDGVEFQQMIAHSNNSYPIVKDLNKFKASQSGSRVLQAKEFKQTETGYSYNQSISFKCSSIFDALTIDMCDSLKNTAGVLSKYKIALYSIKFPQMSQEEKKKELGTEEDEEEEEKEKQQPSAIPKSLNKLLRKEDQIKTIIQHGMKKFNEENNQKHIEFEFYLVLYNSLNIIKRIPCKITLEHVVGEITEQQNHSIGLANVARLKGKLTSVREKLYKIYYYDSKMNAYEFNQIFRKRFKGMNLMYLRQRFGQMTKIYNNPDFKKQVLQNSKSNNYLWHITIPSGTSLQIKGLITKSSDKNQQLEKFIAQFKRDAYTVREEREDDGEEISLTEIVFNQEIDFYIPNEQIKNSSQILLFLKYMDKDGQVKVEEGDIPISTVQNIQQSVKSPEELFESHTLLSFIRPSNFRVIILARLITSPFYENHVGELSVQIHKVLHLDSAQVHDAKGLNTAIRYNNKKIISRHHNMDKISVFALSHMKVKVRVNGQQFYLKQEQNEFTNFIDADGCIIQNEFKTHKFLTSHFSDRIDLKLIMSGQSKEQLNKMMRNMNNENQDEDIEEVKNEQENGEEVEQENTDEYLKEDRSINLCKGSFYVVDSVYAKPNEEEFFFMQPLNEMIYHQNDVMKQFYNILNRKNLYVVGSFKFSPLHWAKVFIRIDGIKNINLNPEHHIIKSMIKKIDDDHETYKDELIYFGVKLRTMVYYSDYSADCLNEHSTSLLEITLNTITQNLMEGKPISFQFETPENANIVYKKNNEVENIAIQMILVMMFEGKEYELSERLYPVKKMCEEKYLNHVINLNLELNEECTQQQVSDNIIFCKNEKVCPILVSRVQAKQEIKIKRNQNEFDRMVIEKKGKLQHETEKLNFRNTTLSEILSNLLSCTQRKVILQTMKEIQELFLYIDYEQYKNDFKLALLTLMNFTRVYFDDFEIVEQCLLNICNLGSQDINQFIQLFQANDGLSIIREIAEILSQIKILGNSQGEKKQVNKKKPVLVSDYISMKQNFSVPILTQEQLQKNDYQYDDLFRNILNNRLKYLDSFRDENGVLLRTKNCVQTQMDYELLDYKMKDDYMKSKGTQTIQLLKLIDFYVAKSVDNVMQCTEVFKSVDILVIDNIGKVKNMSGLYTMIATKVLSLTISEENEKVLGLDIFVNFLNTICSASENMGVEDTLLALKTACKLFSHLCFKKDFSYISKCYNQYFSFIFSLVGSKKVTRYVLNEMIDSLVKEITVISQDPQKIIKKNFSDLVDEKRLLRSLENILEQELLENYVLQENEKELFNEDIVIENTFKFLTILARDFDYPSLNKNENKVEFESLESSLKLRQKTVKKPKRKATIENFLNFLFNKSQGLQNLNKYDITKRKEQLLQKKKQDIISDPLKLKNELATKYLISKLDWK